MSKIMITIPLTKYLKEVAKSWGKTFVTKTYGGQVYLSDEAPGEVFEDEEDKNYIEFNDSGTFMRLPKEIGKLIDLEPGKNKPLKQVIEEIKRKEMGR